MQKEQGEEGWKVDTPWLLMLVKKSYETASEVQEHILIFLTGLPKAQMAKPGVLSHYFYQKHATFNTGFLERI